MAQPWLRASLCPSKQLKGSGAGVQQERAVRGNGRGIDDEWFAFPVLNRSVRRRAS